jgi:hypothetical protein
MKTLKVKTEVTLDVDFLMFCNVCGFEMECNTTPSTPPIIKVSPCKHCTNILVDTIIDLKNDIIHLNGK